MPPITLHMVLARQAAAHLASPALGDAEGPYLLAGHPRINPAGSL